MQDSTRRRTEEEDKKHERKYSYRENKYNEGLRTLRELERSKALAREKKESTATDRQGGFEFGPAS